MGQGPSFLALPGPSAERHWWVGEGGSPPQNRLALAICPLPQVPPVPPRRVGRSGAVAGGYTPLPPHRHWDTPERPPLKEKKKIHLDCTLLLFIAYFVLSVVDNSLLSYIKKYLNDVQYAMP